MRIAQTRFRNFRNVQNALIEWGPGINLLTGANGSGKTNVLEALHILTGWGAFHGSRFADTVRWNEKGATLVAQAEGESSSLIEVAIAARASLRLDRKVCRWGDLRNCVRSLTFLPADMAIIEGSPSIRRRFLDKLCALSFPMYAWKLSEYRKIVQQRRFLLLHGRPVRPTQQTMARLAAWIWECRLKMVVLLITKLTKWPQLLSQPIGITLKRGGAGNRLNAMEDFYFSSEKHAEEERAARRPLVGPHLDELEIHCGTRSAASTLSRGQRRRAALALLLAAASAIQEMFHADPVLLLDEVTSELDRRGREILFETLADTGWQIFATTAESTVPPFDGVTWSLDAGEIRKVAASQGPMGD